MPAATAAGSVSDTGAVAETGVAGFAVPGAGFAVPGAGFAVPGAGFAVLGGGCDVLGGGWVVPGLCAWMTCELSAANSGTTMTNMLVVWFVLMSAVILERQLAIVLSEEVQELL